MTQLPTESVDQFIMRLREKVDCCEFGETAGENIRDQVIEKCLSSGLRRKPSERGRGLTLNDLSGPRTVLMLESVFRRDSGRHLKTSDT